VSVHFLPYISPPLIEFRRLVYHLYPRSAKKFFPMVFEPISTWPAWTCFCTVDWSVVLSFDLPGRISLHWWKPSLHPHSKESILTDVSLVYQHDSTFDRLADHEHATRVLSRGAVTGSWGLSIHWCLVDGGVSVRGHVLVQSVRKRDCCVYHLFEPESLWRRCLDFIFLIRSLSFNGGEDRAPVSYLLKVRIGCCKLAKRSKAR